MWNRGAILGVVFLGILAGCPPTSNELAGDPTRAHDDPTTQSVANHSGISPADAGAELRNACATRLAALESENRVTVASLSQMSRLAPFVSTFGVFVSNHQVRLTDATVHSIPEGDARRTRASLARHMRTHGRSHNEIALEVSSLGLVAFDLLPLEIGASLWTLTSTALGTFAVTPATRVESIQITETSVTLGLDPNAPATATAPATLRPTVTPRGTRYLFFSMVPLPPQTWRQVADDDSDRRAANAAFDAFLASPEGRTQYADVPRDAPLDLALTRYVHARGESLLAQLNLGDAEPSMGEGTAGHGTASANGEASWLTIAFRRRSSRPEDQPAEWREAGMFEDSCFVDVLGDIDGDGAPELLCISDTNDKDADASVVRIFPTVDTLFTTDLSQP
ncbi:MAG: hypothetical protein IPK13_21935 [Deltaproteobacteria bacterium]|nr:hypothetical protein [Deltaproteobacteria bacterium]